MSSAPRLTGFGGDLTRGDYANLHARWITQELAEDAGLRRVDSLTGRQMFARRHGDLAGLIIPNVAPWDDGRVRECRPRP